VWIPCIGPFLGSVLTLVATKGSLPQGILLLATYSFGLSIPVMIAGFASRWFRVKTQSLRKNSMLIRLFSGILLLVFGAYIATKGSYGIGSLIALL